MISNFETLYEKQKQVYKDIVKSIKKDARFLDSIKLEFGPNDSVNEWLIKLMWALKAEVKELDDELLYKHWSKDKIDYHNICIELIDILCFVCNMAHTLKLSYKDLMNIWEQKMAINISRQKNKYSKNTKNENDNKSILIHGMNHKEWLNYINEEG